MKNLIVYSYASYAKLNANKNNQIVLLKYSIDSIRKFTDDVPIVVYLYVDHEEYLSSYLDVFKKYKNLEVVLFNPFVFFGQRVVPPKLSNLKNWRVVFHKWPNFIDAANHYEAEKLLFVDNDTIFYSDPNLVFDLLQDEHSVRATYALATMNKNDSPDYITHLGLEGAINDGVILTSKSVLLKKVKPKYLQDFNKIMDDLIRQVSEVSNLSELSNFSWMVFQFTTFLLLKNLGVNIHHFSINHVALGPTYFENPQGDVMIHHYLNFPEVVIKTLPEEIINQFTGYRKQKMMEVRGLNG